MKRVKIFLGILLLSGLALLSGCDGSSSNSSSGSGKLSLYLTDVPSDKYQAVYVSIDEVLVHQGDEQDDELSDDADGWQVVATPRATYNLLDLVNGAMKKLATSGLDAGTYTQMRLMLKDTPDNGDNLLGQKHPYASYIIDKEDAVHELKVPSGYQSGIKLVHGFEIISGLTVDLILDFDAMKSVVQAGASGNFILKPTIKVLGTLDNGIVSGIITDAGSAVLSGVTVSAQVADADAAAIEDQARVAASTLTDENGEYSMYLPPGRYLIVAYKGAATDYGSAFGPECVNLAVEFNTAFTQDFQLVAKPTGRLAANVKTGNGTVDLSFLGSSDCGDGAQVIEVISLTVAEDGEYRVRLPGGVAGPVTYTVVASSGTETDSAVADVISGEDTGVLFDFTAAP